MARYLGLDSPFGVAHRGGALENLENSPTAFHHAINLGYRVIETDIQATSDGQLVVIHDPDTRRVSQSIVEIRKRTWNELSTLKLANGDSLWRLEDLVNVLGPEIRFNIDPKSDAAVQPLVGFTEHRPELLERICVGSFSSRRLKTLRRAIPGLKTSLGGAEMIRLVLAFVSKRRADDVRSWLPAGVIAIQVPARAYGFDFTNPAFIAFVHDIGLDVHVWTIDAEQDMQRIYACGADAVITDRPFVLKKVLQDLGHWKGE